ncbi:uncharacterized protein LOC133886913 [Phragmites australis]|uniref:uncharacterized protein LOC133886913 n=1 Tax=Phragmites australis TaxID=29695 RepID=UPI002D78EBAF|nr:uncharacterized protein LOC133886913 [Phragmites australis]
MTQNIIDTAVDRVLLECADKVLAENDLQLDGQVAEVFSANDDVHSSESPPTDFLGVGTGGADFDRGSSGCGYGGLVTHAEATLAKAACVRAASTAVRGAAGVGTPAAVLAAAAVEEVCNTPKRSNPRLAKHNDDDSIQKAKKRAAWKNLDFSGGNLQGDLLDPTMVHAA